MMRDNIPSSLKGVRILEISESIAISYLGRLFALMGAEVIKVELPEGDPSRKCGPFAETKWGDISAFFSYLSVNKRFVRLDYRLPSGKKLLRRLAAETDLVAIDLAPKAQEDLGLQYGANDANPRTIFCSVTPFGLTGPYRDLPATDLIVSAAAGISVGTGNRGEEPLPLPLFQTEMQAGLAGACSGMIALLARESAGAQQIDIAAVEVMASHHAARNLPRYLYEGIVGVRNGRRGGHGPYPNTVLPCKDGHIIMASPQVAQWIRFVQAMGNPAWAEDPRYRNRRAMADEYPDEVDGLLSPWLQQFTKGELLRIFIEYRIPFAPLFRGSDIITNEHISERGFLAPVPLVHDGSETIKMPSLPFRFSRSPGATIVRSSAPVGTDTFSVLRDCLGMSRSEYTALSEAGVV